MTCNEAPYVEATIRSLLAQTYRDFTLSIHDDASSDGTDAICRALAREDARITYHRNPHRLGMAANYREAFSHRSRESDFFTWIAGHDKYDRRWLDVLVEALDRHPNAVMAYAETLSIDRDGKLLPKKTKPWKPFDSTGMSTRQRIMAIVEAKGFGRMIYGLFRADAIARCGGIPPVLFPDVVFLWRLCCYGDFLYVPGSPYLRRETKGRMELGALTARQRYNLFPQPSLTQRLPAALSVPAYLLVTRLPRLPPELEDREAAIRRLFARSFFLRDLRKRRLFGRLHRSARWLSAAYAQRAPRR
jgi:glycosyltransferase involved in cell wall biosynthesis